MKKKLLIGSFLIVLAIIAIVMYIYKPHRNIQEETATHQIEAKTLYESFTSDEQTANQKFLDQVIEIKGKVTALDKENKSIVLDNHVNASGIETINVSLNQDVVVKGRCVGYDEIMEEIAVDQSKIIN
jgi:uncharacterized membrane protein